MTTLTLTKPIKAHGEDVSVLTFREPTGKDIRECGVPYSIGQRGDEVVTYPDARNTAKLIVALAGIPTSSVDQLSMADFNAAMMVVIGFFGAAAADTSNPKT